MTSYFFISFHDDKIVYLTMFTMQAVTPVPQEATIGRSREMPAPKIVFI